MPATCCWATTVFPVALLDTTQRTELVKNVIPPAEPARAEDPSPVPHVTLTSFCPTLAPAPPPASQGTISMRTTLVNHATHIVEVAIHRPAVPPAEIQARSCSLGNVSMRVVPHSTILMFLRRHAKSVIGVAMHAAGLWGPTACSAWRATFSRTGPVWSSAHHHFIGTRASAGAVTATVCSAKAPRSAPAVKSHFSSWKPSVSRNVGRDTLQTMPIANAQPALGGVCSAAAETDVTSVTMGSF